MNRIMVNILCRLTFIQTGSWSLLTGIVGTLILAGFLSTIMSLELLSLLLPVMAGINASISGYMLIERVEDDIKHPLIMAAVVGMLVALLSHVAINALCYRFGGFFLVSDVQTLVAATIGMVGGCAGGSLSAKYKLLKAQPSLR